MKATIDSEAYVRNLVGLLAINGVDVEKYQQGILTTVLALTQQTVVPFPAGAAANMIDEIKTHEAMDNVNK